MADQLKAILEKTLSPNQEDQNLAKSVLQTAYDTNYVSPAFPSKTATVSDLW